MSKWILKTLVTVSFAAATLSASAWFDETHQGVAKAAKFKSWRSAAAPDIAIVKADKIERYNHFADGADITDVTEEVVRSQIKLYNSTTNTDGQLYGAIIQSLRDYRQAMEAGAFADYHLVYFAHYIGDLSQPLHNCPYNDYNKTHHFATDGVVEEKVLRRVGTIRRHMRGYEVDISAEPLEDDLIREVARLGDEARKLALRLEAEDRMLTPKEAYAQLGKSAAIFNAVLDALEELYGVDNRY